MKRTVKIVVGLALLGAAFFGGYAIRTARTASASATGRPILYWVDPMHPASSSDRPGIAPDCGMDLVPVYGDPGGARVSQDGPGAGLAPEGLPAGAIRIPAERQQLIGVKYATVEWDESVGRSLADGLGQSRSTSAASRTSTRGSRGGSKRSWSTSPVRSSRPASRC